MLHMRLKESSSLLQNVCEVSESPPMFPYSRLQIIKTKIGRPGFPERLFSCVSALYSTSSRAEGEQRGCLTRLSVLDLPDLCTVNTLDESNCPLASGECVAHTHELTVPRSYTDPQLLRKKKKSNEHNFI